MLYTEDETVAYADKRNAFNDGTDRDLLQALDSVGVKGKVILDIGCGDGKLDQRIKKMGAARLIGIDNGEKFIEIANSLNSDPDIQFQVGDALQLAFEDKSIDVVTTNFVLHYFADTTPVFREIARVLKDDGHYVGNFNITDAAEGYEHLYNTQVPVRLAESVIVLNLVKSRKEIEASVAAAGLTIVKYQELENEVGIDDSCPHKAHLRFVAVLMILKKNN